MRTLLTVISSGLLILGLLIGPADAASSNEGAFGKSLSGTVQSIDGMNVTLMTESGQKSYPITQESVLAGVTKGDQVWFDLNEEGKVSHIAKADDKLTPEGKDSSNPSNEPPKPDVPRKGEIAG